MGLINPWVWLAVVAVYLAGFASGVKLESLRWDASLKDIAEQSTAFIKSFYRAEQTQNASVSGALAKQRDAMAQDARNWRKKADDLKPTGLLTCTSEQPAVPSSSAAASGGAPREDTNPPGVRASVVCGPECVRLWNDALGIGLPEAYDTWRTDAAASAPGSVTGDALIENAAENFAIANQLRAQLLGWQRKACREGWVKC